MKMKKKTGHVLYIIVIIIGGLSLYLLSFFQNNEMINESKESVPEIFEDGSFNRNFMEEYNNYLTANMGMRKELIQYITDLKYEIFNTANVPGVIVGNDGFLYFYETVDDYVGNVTISDRGFYNISRTLYLMEEYVESRGGEFLFVPAPNKSTLYDHMPYNYIKISDKGNLDILKENLNNLDYLELEPIFEDIDEVLYMKKDTHWDNRGAYIVYMNVMKSLGKKYIIANIEDFKEGKDFKGDLSEMLNSSKEEYDYNYYLDLDTDYNFITNTRSVEQSYIESENEDGEGSLLMFRDSFGNSLIDYFSNSFKKAIYSKSSEYDLTQMDKYNSDTVILEIAERNIDIINTASPIFLAPKRYGLTDIKEVKEVELEMNQRDKMIKIQGVILDTKDYKNIYICIDGVFYEMTPQNVLGSDYGFCGYVDGSEVLKDVKVYVN